MRTGILVVCLLLVAGCSIIMPADRAILHSHRLNAVAVNAKVQTITAPTPEEWAACKVWWNAEARTWVATDAWAKGVKPPLDNAGNVVLP